MLWPNLPSALEPCRATDSRVVACSVASGNNATEWLRTRTCRTNTRTTCCAPFLHNWRRFSLASSPLWPVSHLLAILASQPPPRWLETAQRRRCRGKAIATHDLQWREKIERSLGGHAPGDILDKSGEAMHAISIGARVLEFGHGGLEVHSAIARVPV